MTEETNITPALPPLAQLEALLFVSSGPVSVNALARALQISKTDVDRLLLELEADYATRGLRLQRIDSAVQLTTAAELAALIEEFLGLEQFTRLSQAALEVLSIVAYQQPVTRPQIDQIRGVNSDGALRTLLSRSLIEEVGRQETPGRPILYGTTVEFLQYFGLESLAQLPALPNDTDEEGPETVQVAM